MSPCEKYRTRRQLPWKLAVQILKIFMITLQVFIGLYVCLKYASAVCLFFLNTFVAQLIMQRLLQVSVISC